MEASRAAKKTGTDPHVPALDDNPALASMLKQLEGRALPSVLYSSDSEEDEEQTDIFSKMEKLAEENQQLKVSMEHMGEKVGELTDELDEKNAFLQELATHPESRLSPLPPSSEGIMVIPADLDAILCDMTADEKVKYLLSIVQASKEESASRPATPIPPTTSAFDEKLTKLLETVQGGGHQRIEMEGMLLKKSEHLKKWNKRYLTLKDGVLTLWKKKGDKTPHRVQFLEEFSVSEDSDDVSRFKVYFGKKCYYLQAADGAEKQAWVGALQKQQTALKKRSQRSTILICRCYGPGRKNFKTLKLNVTDNCHALLKAAMEKQLIPAGDVSTALQTYCISDADSHLLTDNPQRMLGEYDFVAAILQAGNNALSLFIDDREVRAKEMQTLSEVEAPTFESG